jgi:mannosyltransferase
MNPVVTFDDIIYALQAFGGARTFWEEVTSRVDAEHPGLATRISGGRFDRLRRPRVGTRIFHSSHFRVSASKGVTNITTVHDLAYERRFIGGRGRLLNLYERARAIREAQVLVCISQATRREMEDYYRDEIRGKRIEVIYHGSLFDAAQPVDRDGTAGSRHATAAPVEPYFLYVGGRGFYKRFSLLLRAFRATGLADQRVRLLCTGSAFTPKEHEDIEALKLAGSVKALGNVSVGVLRDLYLGAIALVYPSVYEGFGIPPLDAMTCGCPVIAANATSIPEIVRDGGILCKPDDLDELAVAMLAVQSDDRRAELKERGRQVAAGFGWNTAATQYAALYRSLV